jgi:hypothetical protein
LLIGISMMEYSIWINLIADQFFRLSSNFSQAYKFLNWHRYRARAIKISLKISIFPCSSSLSDFFWSLNSKRSSWLQISFYWISTSINHL